MICTSGRMPLRFAIKLSGVVQAFEAQRLALMESCDESYDKPSCVSLAVYSAMGVPVPCRLS